MPLYSEGQSLSANQLSSTYLNSWLRYNYFCFGKNVRHIGILLPVSSLVISPQSACYILHQAPELHPNRTTYCRNMTSYRFFKMAAAAAQYYFRFHICWWHFFRRSMSISEPNFVDIPQFVAWDITTSVLEKQTSAVLKFDFRFPSRPSRRNLHVILHQATEFRPTRSTHRGSMTSYPFLKMAAAAAQYYFRFRICWITIFKRLKSNRKPNFVDISPLTAEI